MPKLSIANRPTKKITLPKSKGEVVIYTDMLAGDLLDMPDGVSSAEKGFYMVPRIAKSWNFTGDDDLPLEINRENLKLLNTDDFKYLISQIGDTMPDVSENKLSAEKKSPSTSTS